MPPKQEVFPTPRPLSREEQALIRFAREGPPAVKKAVLEDQKHWDDPMITDVAELAPKPPGSRSQQDR